MTRYHAQRQSHRVDAKDRFAATWAEEARLRPTEVLDDVDDAVTWILDQTAGALRYQREPAKAAKTAGLVDGEDWERAYDTHRASLERGEPAGRVIATGSGSVLHVHVYPIEEKR